jgi:amino acid permease
MMESARDGALSSVTSPSWVLAVYLFNLIVGVGALSLPLAFASSGIALGTVCLCTVAAVAFITATFVCELTSSPLCTGQALEHTRPLQVYKYAKWLVVISCIRCDDNIGSGN